MSKKSASKPMPGTLPFRVLMRINALGGRASLDELLPTMPANKQVKTHLLRVIDELNDWLLVRNVGMGIIDLTVVGRNHLMDFDLPTPKYVGQIVPAATVPEFRPLNMAKLMAGRPQREGMDDCAGLPSLMAGQRVVRERSE